MISRIVINDVATFDASDHVMDDLGRINFIFGSNGSGKTTISRVIENPGEYTSSSISWENGTSLHCSVYNVDFVKENFSDVSGMPGIFTLGKEEMEIIEKIETIDNDILQIMDKGNQAEVSLQGENGNGGKLAEKVELKNKYIEKFWKQKQKYDSSPIKSGMEGALGNRERFFMEIQQQFLSNKSDLLTYDVLTEKASIVFNKQLEPISEIPIIDFSELLALSSAEILSKKVIGKEDVAVGDLITRLGNSDWVKSGMNYLENSDGVCPFCQRTLNEALQQQLEEYFDETYISDMQEIEKTKSEYQNITQNLLQRLNNIVSSDHNMVDNQSLKAYVKELSRIIEENSRLIDYKKENASLPVALKECNNLVSQISAVIEEANSKIKDHNEVVTHIDDERKKLKEQTWRFVSHEIASDIEEFHKLDKMLDKEIISLQDIIKKSGQEKERLHKEKKELQSQLTSVIPTKDLINKYLEEFGFNGFRLDIGKDEHSYRIIRNDGMPVGRTLSEGEKNFVSFLYFYSLLNGSFENSGIVEQQIVFIDDPVSSMDSDVLFIVSTLIRRLICEMKHEQTTIKQMFVATHNLYFYKEVSFERGLPKGITNQMKFFVVNKIKGKSEINYYEKNPIKSTYELLWADVNRANENPQSSDLVSLRNTMRRILEYYLHFCGDTSVQKLPDAFEEDDRLVVRALLSWANDGSHSSFDDFSYTPPMANGIEIYISIFRKIFERLGHIDHYNMMMKIAEED